MVLNGVKNYTYDSANRLVEISDQLSVTSLSYNGLGQRLSMNAAGVIATYVLDGDRPLTAESNGNTTFYLYGLGGIGEETSAWSYSLPDGTNTSRQLTDLSGEITLSARYTPWGDTLDTFGTGNFTFGYLGGVLDATTGLLYVGNGQYYDPATGRFLTRDVYPNSPNPYVPWNPIGAILGPLAVLSMFYGRKKTKNKWDTVLIIVLLGVSSGMGLVACAPQPPAPNPNTMPVPTTTPAPSNPSPVQAPLSTEPTTVESNAPIATTSPTTPITLPDCPTPTNTLTPSFVAQPDSMDGETWGPNSMVLYNLYLRLHRERTDDNGNATLWWRVYGQDGQFSLVDFIAMIFIREVSAAPGLSGINMNDYVEAMGRHGYIWCKEFSGYNCDSTTNRGLVYFVYEWSQPARQIANNCRDVESCNLSANFQSIYGLEAENWALRISQGIQNPLPAWRNFDKNALYDAGNLHPQVIRPEKVAEMHQMKHKAHYESPDGLFYITTFCESVFLRDSMNLFNAWGCTLPPNSS